MDKAVLISIQPQWCEKIASGKKTLEIRKTKPKLQTPFKCYIYCTKESYKGKYLHTSEQHGKLLFWHNPNDTIITVQPEEYDYTAYTCGGKVIGEFVCDRIDEFQSEFVDNDCYEDIRLVWDNEDYPDEKEFKIITSNEDDNSNECQLCKGACLTFEKIKKYVGIGFETFYGWHISDLVIYDKPKQLSEFNINRAPQSWCYVQED